MYQYISKEGHHDPLFYFTTKHGLEYFVSFRKMDLDNYFFQNLYSIDFWEINNQRFNKDLLIRSTITKIIHDYLIEFPFVMLYYVCDSMDAKQYFRKKLFDNWYNKQERKEFSKLNFEYHIQDEIEVYHLGFIYKEEFYKSQDVIDKVSLQLEEFTNFK